MDKRVICWWSGGITSAVACKLAIDLFGKKNCEVIFIDTKNEDKDTYRFKNDCEVWYDLPIKTITAIGEGKYNSIVDVWTKHLSLNTATGAICSTELKRMVREDWQKNNEYDYQIFGYEFESKEFNRAKSMYYNHPKAKSIFPLLMFGYDKKKCGDVVQLEGISLPVSYYMGFKNNNCLNTGCVQGGIGYWQLMKDIKPENFDKMAELEHRLTDLKGEPVTMLKDQSNEAKQKENKDALLFLKKHSKYPHILCIDDKPRQKVEPLFDCNGFCGTNDLIKRSETEKEINYK